MVEGVLVALDVGTSKVCALIGEIGRDGRLTVIGHGTVPSSGLKRGAVVNIEQTVRSIRDAVERAERLSGWKIDKAFVGVGGAQVESLNSTGQVSVAAHTREVSRDDIRRAVEQARTIPIPSNREVLHVERRGFTVDGQEGVKDPLGMSALRLEVETHIVTAPQTAVQNLMKCVAQAGVKIDELVVNALASAEAVANETERELGVAVADVGAGTIDLAMFNEGSPFRTSVLPVGGNFVTNDIAIGIKTSLPAAEELKVRHGTCDLRGHRRGRGDRGLGPRRGGGPDDQPARAVPDHRVADARDVRAHRRRDPGRRRGHAPGRADPDRRRRAAGGHRRARPRGPLDAGPRRRPVGRRRPHRLDPDARPTRRASACSSGAPRCSTTASRRATSRRRPRASSAACGAPSRACCP